MRFSTNLRKKDSFRHILRSSVSMYESSDSQFFRTTTRTHLGEDAFDESRLVMTLLTNSRVRKILFSFRSLLEGKAGKMILELTRLLATNSSLLDAEDNMPGPLSTECTADLPFLGTLLALRQRSREPRFCEVMDSFVLLA